MADHSFEEVLREAKQRYFQGEPQQARELLQGLQLRLYAGETAPWEAVVEALTYLGEIYYVQGNQEQATIAFRYLLERDPDAPISPFHHTIEVVNLFELVRTTVLAERELEPLPVPPPVPAPLSTYLPLGIPQLAQGRTGAGVIYGGLQAALGVTSLAMFVHVNTLNPEPGSGGQPNNDAEIRRVDQLRYGAQWPSTIGFYLLWGVSSIDAARWHQRHLGRQRPVTLHPGPGPGLVISGRF